jgi:hypothetical protein
MGSEVMEVAGDLRHAASYLNAALAPAASQVGWDLRAGEIDWTCRDTLDHLANALCGYAASLANGLGERRRHHPRNGDPSALPADLLEIVVGFAGVLAAVAEGADTTTRAYHPAGMADRDGFVAMGCDEILVHGHDIATGLGIEYRPPGALAGRVLARLFPWAPAEVDPWMALLWANGRIGLDGREQLSADWWWHCRPLAEWTGQVHRRSELDPPGWR